MLAESIHVESKLDWRLVEGREGECHRARSDDLTHQSFAVRGEQGIVIDGVIPLLDDDFTVIEASSTVCCAVLPSGLAAECVVT